MKLQHQIGIKNYKSTDGFINHYQKLIKDVVIPYQYDILNDSVENAEKSHVIKNFVNAGKALRNEDCGDGFYGMVFQDSDAAKWLEAVAYSLAEFPDKELEKTADELIELISAAQDSDGYLNTYFTVKDREKRWENLCEGHELYCAGHMMEAATAYFEATGKRTLLDVMKRNADCIYKHFITENAEGCPGHPEVELALLKMFRATDDKRFLELSEHFINVRGTDPFYFEHEKEKRNWTVWGNDGKDHDYQQSGKPVREQTDATGHSVRAVYLYTGMSNLASQTGDDSLKSACKALWKSVTQRRMYVTGGIGSTVNGEAFTVDYDLPNDTAYAETCASIGLIFFASRMLELEVNSEYTDVMERAFYNTVLAGMQLDGKRFFYVNPLEIDTGISGVASTHWHAKTTRPTWYSCACCPPNVARLISSFGKYAYGENDETAFCHLYAEGEIAFDNGLTLSCETKYPYSFDVKYTVKNGGKSLALRIPDWSVDFSVTLNGAKADCELKSGYVYLPVVQTGDCIILTLDSTAHRLYTSTRVPENTGCVAIQRGPLVYCAEGVDNEDDVLSLSLDKNGGIAIGKYDAGLLSGVTPLFADGFRTAKSDKLYSYSEPTRTKAKITLIPYYAWGNRGENQMRVWLPEA